MNREDAALVDLVSACHTAPTSSALVRALLAEAGRQSAPAALDDLETADPQPFDAEMRPLLLAGGLVVISPRAE